MWTRLPSNSVTSAGGSPADWPGEDIHLPSGDDECDGTEVAEASRPARKDFIGRAPVAGGINFAQVSSSGGSEAALSAFGPAISTAAANRIRSARSIAQNSSSCAHHHAIRKGHSVSSQGRQQTSQNSCHHNGAERHQL